ncbi:MAG: hypothetical protein HQM03_14975 [Magnetococcales bacterium]|nr:hypothetical protein [Magnetococcales bacterium]
MSTPDFASAFRVGTLSLDGKVGVFSGDEDPRRLDTNSFPVGSVYFRTDGTTWKRTGPGPSDWMRECQQRPTTRHGCPWLQVVRAIQAISTEVAVLRLIQGMSTEIHCEHQ